MTIEVYTRHSPDCPHKDNRYYRRCRCRKWLIIVDKNKRLSAGTRSWEEAERRAREMNSAAPAAVFGVQAVRSAVQSFIEDKTQQGVTKNWHRKLERELTDFAAYCDSKVLLQLDAVTLKHLEDYRKTWKGAGITRRKRQERLRSFYLYCQRHKWTTENTAAHLSPIRFTQPPTLPLTKEQFSAALEAARTYHPRGRDREYRRRRAEAMLLLLRWSGLRIGDAGRLERSALNAKGNLLLYTQKTGESVYVPLPPDVVKLLRKLPNDNPRYFFWNGTSAKGSPGVRWWVTLKAIFKAAGMPDAHPHMLRDTFAVEMLLAGVPIEQVSMLLGHSSVKITERHYAPWVHARQKQLEESVRKAWDK